MEISKALSKTLVIRESGKDANMSVQASVKQKKDFAKKLQKDLWLKMKKGKAGDEIEYSCDCDGNISTDLAEVFSKLPKLKSGKSYSLYTDTIIKLKILKKDGNEVEVAVHANCWLIKEAKL